MPTLLANYLLCGIFLLIVPYTGAQDRTSTGRLLPPPAFRIPESDAVDHVNLCGNRYTYFTAIIPRILTESIALLEMEALRRASQEA
jgi:hypothetical protein